MQWRALTPDEISRLPEARLGGALLGMLVAAALICALAVLGAMFDFARLQAIGGRYMAAVAFIAVWSAAFVLMTLVRLPATPTVASAGLLLWLAYRGLVAVTADGGWPLLVDLLGEAVLAAGFCGYMATGRRPNAYYRRRLPTD